MTIPAQTSTNVRVEFSNFCKWGTRDDEAALLLQGPEKLDAIFTLVPKLQNSNSLYTAPAIISRKRRTATGMVGKSQPGAVKFE